MTIRKVTCGACARVMGTAWLIDLAVVTNADLETIQSAIGIPASPLLRDPARWSEPLARIGEASSE